MKKMVVGILLGMLLTVAATTLAATNVKFNKKTLKDVTDLACLGAASADTSGLSEAHQELHLQLANKYCKEFLY